MKDRVRLASIGVGWWGGIVADAVGRSEFAELATCFSPTAAHRRDFAEARGARVSDSLSAVLEADDIDGVLVVTPHRTRVDVIEQAAEAGKHVYVEKPLALTVAEAKRATQACEDAGVILQVGHQRRRGAATRELKRLLDSGEAGVLHQVETNISVPGGQDPTAGWRFAPEENPVGGMAALGVHMVDNLNYLGGRIDRCFGFSRRVLNQLEIDEATAIIVEFEAGALGYLGTSFVVPNRVDTAILATQMNAWSEDDGRRLFVQPKDDDYRSELPIEPIDDIRDEIDEFARAIRGEVHVETGGEAGIEVAVFMEAVAASLDRNQAVSLAEFR